jgi:hypothetical protein
LRTVPVGADGYKVDYSKMGAGDEVSDRDARWSGGCSRRWSQPDIPVTTSNPFARRLRSAG